MADQTDIAFTCGFISAPIGAVILHKVSGITRWLAYPIGAILGATIVIFMVYIAISLTGKCIHRWKPHDRINGE